MKTATLNCLAVPMDCARRNVSASSYGTVLSGTGKRRQFGCQKACAKAQQRAADPDGILAWRPPAFPEPPKSQSPPEPAGKQIAKEGKVTGVRPGSFNL